MLPFLISVSFISCNFLHASFWTHLTIFPFLLFLFYYFLCSHPLLFFLVSLSPLSLPFLFSSCPSLCTAHPSPPSSAHVDMSTVAFDVDPLDLDAEEPPEFQGDPRSPKGMSGSVTSPQANAHRLPFFKKVTLGAPDTSLTSTASLLPPAFVPLLVRSNLSFPLSISH